MLKQQWTRALKLLEGLQNRLVNGPPLRLPPEDDPRRFVGYLCRVAWEHELGHDGDGTIIYPSPDALRRGQQCVKEGACGIVEVQVNFRRLLSEGTTDSKL